MRLLVHVVLSPFSFLPQIKQNICPVATCLHPQLVRYYPVKIPSMLRAAGPVNCWN